MLDRQEEYRYMSDYEYGGVVWKRIEHFKKIKHTTWRLVALRMNMSLANLYMCRRNHYMPKPQKILTLSAFFNCSMEDIYDPYKPLPPIRK